MSNAGYSRSRCAREGASESSDCIRKWYGVVVLDSKYRPSIEPMQPSVQCGRSIGAIVVP